MNDSFLEILHISVISFAILNQYWIATGQWYLEPIFGTFFSTMIHTLAILYSFHKLVDLNRKKEDDTDEDA